MRYSMLNPITTKLERTLRPINGLGHLRTRNPKKGGGTRHHDKPRIPVVEGVDVFKGTVFHSHDYRRNTPFKGKRLVLLGATSSGMDISHQIAKVADTVFLAHIKDPLPTALKPNVIEKPGIKKMTEDSVVFVDGSEERVDALIYCTGFEYNMPFLDGVVTVSNEHVMPVFKNIVHIEHPSLMFVGLAKKSAYFLLNHENARFAIYFFLGNFKLPTKKEMYEDELQEREYRKSMKMTPHQAHYVSVNNLQWKWNEEFAQIAGFKPLEPVIKMLWDVSIGKLDYDFVNFRDFDYYVTGSKSFEITHI